MRKGVKKELTEKGNMGAERPHKKHWGRGLVLLVILKKELTEKENMGAFKFFKKTIFWLKEFV
jgi:hypothetical protein